MHKRYKNKKKQNKIFRDKQNADLSVQEDEKFDWLKCVWHGLECMFGAAAVAVTCVHTPCGTRLTQ